MTKYFYSLILSFVFAGLQAQNCHIGELNIDILPCNNQGFFNVKLDFDYENTSPLGFTVSGNGQDYGNYFYENLPITLTGPFLGNGINLYELVVKDKGDPLCKNFKNFGPVNCNIDPCHIYDLVVDTLECTSNSTYSVLVDFAHENVGGAGFNLYYNNNFWATYDYTELPLIINNLPVSSNNFDVIKVKDIVNPDCQDIQEYPGMKCGLQDCSLSNLTATVSECDSTGHFYITLNFTYNNTGNEGFNVHGNGTNYGNFDYGNLPITLGPFETNNVKKWEFVVEDNQNESCHTSIQLGILDCDDECEIYEWDAIPLECTSDSTYALKINFLYNDYPDTLFWVYGNGTYLGQYNVKNLPVTILNFPQDGNIIDTITICAPDTIPNCCHTRTFEGFQCPMTDCHILELAVNNISCTSDSTYSAWINFIYQNTSAQGFDVSINNVFLGNFPYSSLPLTLTNIPSNGNTIDVIQVCDHEFQDCCKIKDYQGLSCGTNGDCNINELEVNVGDCTSDSTYQITVNFNHVNSSASFDLYMENGVKFGTYLYSQLPLTINNYPKIGTGPNDLVKVCDHEKPDCCKAKEFPSPACGTNNNCLINELVVTVGDCSSPTTYHITINFNHVNTSGQFDVFLENGTKFGTYSYSQLPLTIDNYPKIGTGPNDIVQVCDHEYQDCCKVKEFASPNCGGNNDCVISELQVTVGDCTSPTTYTITINFNHVNSSSSFDLFTENGVKFGTYLYSQLPLTINNYPKIGTGPNDLVKVCDHEFDDCCKASEFPSPNCGGNNNCVISELEVTVGDCTSPTTYTITINFNHTNGSSSFDLFTENGVKFGTYLYSQLPLTINNYPKIGTGPNDVVKVCDHEFDDCCKAHEYPSPACGGDPCHLYDIVVTPVECTSNTTYKLILNFNHDNTPSPSFDIFANGVLFGTYQYSQLPLTINNYPSNGNAGDLIKVRDHENHDCFAVKEFEGLTCENTICAIVELDVDLGGCTSDSTYEMVINFIVQNPASDRFDLYANNVYFGTYFYSQLPLAINNFPVSGNTNDHVKVCDHENADCCKVKEYKSPECFSGAPIIYDIHVTVNNCINAKFEAVIDFEHNNTGNDGFRIQGNGNDYGNFSYSQVPVKLPGLLADNTTEYEFAVIDNQFPIANDYSLLGKVTCTTSTFDPKSDEIPFIYYFEGDNLIVKALEQQSLKGYSTFDIMGKLLQTNNSTASQYVINTQNWVPGMYVLFVQGNEGKKSVLVAKPK